MVKSWIQFGTGLDVVSGFCLDMPGIHATTIVLEQNKCSNSPGGESERNRTFIVFDQVDVGTKTRHVHSKFDISSVPPIW
jgi:hypothetical protein